MGACAMVDRWVRTMKDSLGITWEGLNCQFSSFRIRPLLFAWYYSLSRAMFISLEIRSIKVIYITITY